MDLIFHLTIGGILIIITFIFQAICFEYLLHRIPYLERRIKALLPKVWKSYLIMVVVTIVTAVIIAEVWVWALFYLAVDAFPDLESALYFSTTTFTTVGFGDVYLGPDWRMLSAVESINGFLIFGWAAAFLWEVINNLYRKEGDAIDRMKKP